jgi:flavin-binding protein dodecin
MAVATFETAIAAGTAESLDRAFASVEELSAEDVQSALDVCDFIQTRFRKARESIESALCQGVDAKAFAAKYERAVGTLDSVMGAVSRVLERLKGGRLPVRGEELISRYQNLNAVLANLRQFLLEALSRAKNPLRPIDWQRVREVEEAYARGETKPFRNTAEKCGGS